MCTGSTFTRNYFLLMVFLRVEMQDVWIHALQVKTAALLGH